MDLHYGSGSVYGYNSIDQICPKVDQCGSNYSFINVLYQSGLRGMMYDQSGILGLSPKRTSPENDLFIEKLKKDGTIKQAIFSLMVGIGRN
jgi:hypothetical protein